MNIISHICSIVTPKTSVKPSISDKNYQNFIRLTDTSSTPFFACDANLLKNNFLLLKSSISQYWPGNFDIAYSFKTNYDIAQNGKFKALGGLAEVVSEREFNMAVSLGYPFKKIIYNGPNKSLPSLKRALENKTLVNIDNMAELEKIISLIPSLNSKPNLGLRLNIKNPFLSHQSRFGFSIDNNAAENAIKILTKYNIKNIGFHIHLGSDIPNPNCYYHAAKQVSKFQKNIADKFGTKVSIIDFGGGFPSSGIAPFDQKYWSVQPIEKYLAQITSGLSSCLSPTHKIPRLILEPGRFLVDDTVYFITSVIQSQKILKSEQTILVDATVNMLPLIWYRPQIVNVINNQPQKKSKTLFKTTVFGSSCQEKDILFQGKLPLATQGDLLVFSCVGAYNKNMSADFIYEKPPTIFFPSRLI